MAVQDSVFLLTLNSLLLFLTTLYLLGLSEGVPAAMGEARVHPE